MNEVGGDGEVFTPIVSFYLTKNISTRFPAKEDIHVTRNISKSCLISQDQNLLIYFWEQTLELQILF